MAIEMTPNGTYGATRSPGTLANSVLKRFGGLLVGLYRVLGGRGMRALGAPLLLLTTTSADAGWQRGQTGGATARIVCGCKKRF